MKIKSSPAVIIFSLAIITGFGNVSCKKTATNGGGYTPPPVTPPDTAFTNPLLPAGSDPWVVQRDTNYYYTHTMGNRIAIYKTNKMSALKNATNITIWIPPATGPYSKELWAPEIHYLQNKWYIYFAADDGDNKNHRIYVLEKFIILSLIGFLAIKRESCGYNK